jgi:enamine deaminase RidA (YjgF/YER057c/UK114 family)
MTPRFDVVNPRELGKPSGFVHGLIVPAGSRLLFIAGQTAIDEGSPIAAEGLVQQFDRSLSRVLTVLREAGGQPEHIARMIVYVTCMDDYRASRSTLRDVWRRHMGSHYPAMALVEVGGLVDRNATVEIEATAVLP